jgi:hypothetical protein
MGGRRADHAGRLIGEIRWVTSTGRSKEVMIGCVGTVLADGSAAAEVKLVRLPDQVDAEAVVRLLLH